MDQKAVAFARSWATRYVRTKHPHGLDVEDVENRILESLYEYGRGKFPDGIDPDADPAVKEALSEALNDIQNESRRNLRALCPWQVRNAEPHLAAQAHINLARDMHGMRIRQSVRENDRRCVRLVLNMMSPEDRLVAHDFMELSSWQKVAARRGMSEGTFRRRVLNDFVVPYFHSNGLSRGSTDVGDVCWLTPTAEISAVTSPSGAPSHSWQNVSIGKHSIAHKGMLYAGKVLACTAVDLFEQPGLLAAARAEFAETAEGRYICPIEPDAVAGPQQL